MHSLSSYTVIWDWLLSLSLGLQPEDKTMKFLGYYHVSQNKWFSNFFQALVNGDITFSSFYISRWGLAQGTHTLDGNSRSFSLPHIHSVSLIKVRHGHNTDNALPQVFFK